ERTAHLREGRTTTYEGDHFALSFRCDNHPSDDQCRKAVRDFLDRYGADRDTHQYFAYRHSDTENDHLHILVNRVGRDGNVLNVKWQKKNCKQAAISTAREIEGIEETPETRSLWLNRGELELMGREQRPTENFQTWVEEKGSGHGVDLNQWSADDWRQFADAPGRFLNQIKAELEALYSAPAPSPQVEHQPEPSASPASGRDQTPLGEGTFRETSELDAQGVAASEGGEKCTEPSSQSGAEAGFPEPPSQSGAELDLPEPLSRSGASEEMSELPSQSGAKVELPSNLQPPLDLETLAEDPHQAKAQLRRIYDSYQQGQGDVKVARALLDAGYNSEAAAAIVGQSPDIQGMGDREKRVEQTRSTVNEATRAYNRDKEQELRVGEVAPICEALLDEVGASEFEGTRHLIKRDGDRLRLYDRQGELLMEAQRQEDGQWHDTGRSKLSRDLARYFQQEVAPHLQKQLTALDGQLSVSPQSSAASGERGPISTLFEALF
ncbi:MAG: relaxase/mobilization nuclease domain-containing protein, partial [Cyanobacteriota bacterium]|nr:relaxase/mobilization nuclease domain-containing protein [Cyanobacteriota bacterium]